MGQAMWQPELMWGIQGERVYLWRTHVFWVTFGHHSEPVNFRVGGLKSPRSDIPFSLSSVGIKNKNNPPDIKKRQGEHWSIQPNKSDVVRQLQVQVVPTWFNFNIPHKINEKMSRVCNTHGTEVHKEVW